MNGVNEERFYTSTYYKINMFGLGGAIIFVLTIYILKLHTVMIEAVIALFAFGYNLSTWHKPIVRITETNLIYGFIPLIKKSIPLNSIKSVELKGSTMFNSKIIVLYDENTKRKTYVIQAWIFFDYRRLFSILNSRLTANIPVIPPAT